MCVLSCLDNVLKAQIVSVGSGSYTTTFPGTDEAGRNGFPAGSPQLSGNAADRPVPTNDWWSNLILNDHSDNLFNYPMTMKTVNSGLVVSYIPWGVIDDQQPIVVGVTGLNATKTTVSDYSDWTVTMDWNQQFQVTSGIGMPFLYFEKGTNDIAEITINLGDVSVSDEMIVVRDARNGADFVIYAPTGSTWSQDGNTYTSSLNDNNYWSMAMIPQDASNASAIAEEYQKYAYVFPVNSTADWVYDNTTSVLRTDFNIETDIKEGNETNVLIGLLPHQWSHLTNDSPQPEGYSYTTVRGEMKTLDGNAFSTENTFNGILPTLPYLSNYSDDFSLADLDEKITLMENDQLATWTDSYNDGQVVNRLVQTARIAHEMGNLESRDKLIATVKARVEDWLSAEQNEVAFIFYYNKNWTAMLGYPAGHGQDTNINDHHFHWGYFIHAAAFIEQFEPGWVALWGEMINLLVRDAASRDRDDSLFPYLRNFSPYAGHSWANGFATFPQGNDQESTSESMQFNSSLIHWGAITGNDEIRDLGIYLYTTEQSAIEEYWFDINERIFPTNDYSLVSRVWGNSYDNGTFWTSDIEASYGIELYPIHGGSLYLGHHRSYAEQLWSEIEKNTGILNNDDNVNLWHDVMWKYLAFTDPQKAIELYDSYPDRSLKFGVSDAQTYYWLHSMNAMGQVDASITADYPVAAAFVKDGEYTYVAHNYSNAVLDVTFSNGFVLNVPAKSLATNRDATVSGSISSSFDSAYPGGSVLLTVTAEGGNVDKVAYYDDGTFLGETTGEPFTFKAENLAAGKHGFYAKIYEGETFGVTNVLSVYVGEQVAFNGSENAIPGTIEAGLYDVYEGGTGQGIVYSDISQNNEGDYRTDEGVDVVLSGSEGATIGWIAGGEWVEYTVNVSGSALYELSFRFASGNQSGGGPFHLELDGTSITDDIFLTYTGDWDTWESKMVADLAMPEGEHVLRLVFDHGEFNIGRMNFAYQEELPYSQPIANAGENISVISPETTARLDGSMSTDPDNDPLTYEWVQIYGPSMLTFSDHKISNPNISNLEDGVYKCRLTVTDGTYDSFDDVLVIVSETGNLGPNVSIDSPKNGASFKEGEAILITATATDLEGEITNVEFYAGDSKLGEDEIQPFEFTWTGAGLGSHVLTAVATDDFGATATSEPVQITVDEAVSCSETGFEATEGTFTVGYKATFETVGNAVIVTFELLDDKSVTVAYLREESPFTETEMSRVSDRVFTKTLTGLTNGTSISVACKFDVGEVLATKYLQYEVGTACTDEEDTKPPSNFTAEIGSITFSSIELILNGEDESGRIIYRATYGSTTKTLSVDDGKQASLDIHKLTENTMYAFSITATDIHGNLATNGPIELDATTTENTSTDCEGIAFEAKFGSFDVGYAYAFETVGTDVEITFELLDEKEGVNAILQKESPSEETYMTHISGKKYAHTLTGQIQGAVLRYACKFEFAGGQVETKYFSYEVGETCSGMITGVKGLDLEEPRIYPNPVSNQLTIDWQAFESVSIFALDGRNLLNSDDSEISVSQLKKGIYMLKIYGSGDRSKVIRLIKD